MQGPRGRAAASTVEGLMYALRAGGTALTCPYTRRPLSQLSEAQLHEVSARLQRFQPNIARPWTPVEVEMLVASGLIYMDSRTQVSIDALKRIRDKMDAERAAGHGTDGASTNTRTDRS